MLSTTCNYFLSNILKPLELILLITATYPGSSFSWHPVRCRNIIWVVTAAVLWSSSVLLAVLTTMHKIRDNNGTVTIMLNSAYISWAFISVPMMTFTIAIRYGSLLNVVEQSLSVFQRFLHKPSQKRLILCISVGFVLMSALQLGLLAFIETGKGSIGEEISQYLSQKLSVDERSAYYCLMFLEIAGEYSTWGVNAALAYLAVTAVMSGLCVAEITKRFLSSELPAPGAGLKDAYINNCLCDYRTIERIVVKIEKVTGLLLLMAFTYDTAGMIYNSANYFQGNGAFDAGGVVYLMHTALRTACYVFLSDKVEAFAAAFNEVLQEEEIVARKEHYMLLLNNLQNNPAVLSIGSCVRVNRQTVLSWLGLYLTYLLLSYDKGDRNPATLSSKDLSIHWLCNGTHTL